jgi:hypothetical protein
MQEGRRFPGRLGLVMIFVLEAIHKIAVKILRLTKQKNGKRFKMWSIILGIRVRFKLRLHHHRSWRRLP